MVARLGARPEECHFWATHGGAELDLLVVRGGRRRGSEFKRSAAPRVTKSMHIALRDLKLDRLEVIHLGAHSFPMAERIAAIPIRELDLRVEPL